ncbi:MAG: Jag N-terminal domain-containing protein [Synergistales bacterium]|nr:Jag N-terminal domain-containing protein [Synergistales bacterium]
MNDQEKIVIEAGSLEEAKAQAAEEWGLNPEEISISLVEEEKRLFGLLGKKVKVEARPLFPPLLLRAKRLAGELLVLMGLDVTAEIEEGRVDLSGPDAGIVIGRYGESLKSMEYLLNLILRDVNEGERLHLDSEGYRQRRIDNLEKLALNAADDAMRRHRPVRLEPMTSWERRIVHLALKDRTDVETRSAGEDPYRKVVVWPRGEGRSRR